MSSLAPELVQVIRAKQRDSEFTSKLKQDIDDMILEVFGKFTFIIS